MCADTKLAEAERQGAIARRTCGGAVRVPRDVTTPFTLKQMHSPASSMTDSSVVTTVTPDGSVRSVECASTSSAESLQVGDATTPMSMGDHSSGMMAVPTATENSVHESG